MLSILINAFLVFQAALPGDSSMNWSNIALDVAKSFVPTSQSADGTTYIADVNASDLVRKIVGHFAFFMIDGIFVSLYAHYQFYYDNNKPLMMVIIAHIGIFFSVITEIIQTLVPGRLGDIIDMLIDFGGYALGSAIVLLILFLVDKHKNKVVE